MVGRGGVEPPTSRLSGVRSNHLSYRPIRAGRLVGLGYLASRLRPAAAAAEPAELGGAYRDRTDDLLNAIQSLSQLS
jgi:hypothetical protein